jgi:cellulose synthase/poly-beta-1,6-N-acetylglucosamine synthase-like glycosyltransferase
MYYRRGWISISEFNLRKAIVKTPETMISVIVSARNEEKQIGALLDSLVDQTYPRDWYEVIVVDDHSEDKTAEIVLSYNDKNVKLISLKEYIQNEKINSFKKKAIETAISQCKGEIIVTTDADCTVSKNWLKNIYSYFEINQPKMLVMPVLIKYNKSFFSVFQTLDFMCLQGITGAAVQQRTHGMCNGANLAYTKEVFYELGGFNKIDHIASGDDMLLLHKVASKYPDDICYLKSKEVIVETAPAYTLKEFINQRIRWAGKTGQYNDKSILMVLLLVYFLNLSFVVSFIFLFFSVPIVDLQLLFFYLLAFKIIIELYFIFPVAQFFGKINLLWIFPLLQPFHIIYTVIAGFLGMAGSYTWKDRKVK